MISVLPFENLLLKAYLSTLNLQFFCTELCPVAVLIGADSLCQNLPDWKNIWRQMPWLLQNVAHWLISLTLKTKPYQSSEGMQFSRRNWCDCALCDTCPGRGFFISIWYSDSMTFEIRPKFWSSTYYWLQTINRFCTWVLRLCFWNTLRKFPLKMRNRDFFCSLLLDLSERKIYPGYLASFALGYRVVPEPVCRSVHQQ